MNPFHLFRHRVAQAAFLGSLCAGWAPLAGSQALVEMLTAARTATSAGGQVTAQPAAKPAGAPAAKLPETAVPATVDKSAYAEIYRKNVFDSKRQPWAVKSEASPETSVTPITPADAEVYGVMMFGDYKKAIIKLGQGFKFAPQPKNKGVPRPFVTLGVGESLGPYLLTEINEKNVVFASGGAQFSLAFTHKKIDRPLAAAATPMAQAPVVLPAPTPTIVQGIEPIVDMPAAAPAAPPAAPAVEQPVPAAAPPPAPAAAAPQTAAAPATAAPSTNAAAAPQIQGMSLLDAIQAAQAAKK